MAIIRFFALLAAGALLLAEGASYAQETPPGEKLAVIVNPSNPVSQLSRAELEKIFMGKRGFWEWGKPIKAADLIEQGVKEEDSSKALFASEYLGKSLAVLKSYWIRAIFSGKGQPPLVFWKSRDVVNFVAENVEAIGYIPAKDADPERVKHIAIIGAVEK